MLRPATAFISGCNCKNKTNPSSSGLCFFFWNPIPAYGLKLHFPIFTTPYFCATCRIARYTQRMLLMEVQGFSRLAMDWIASLGKTFSDTKGESIGPTLGQVQSCGFLGTFDFLYLPIGAMVWKWSGSLTPRLWQFKRFMTITNGTTRS